MHMGPEMRRLRREHAILGTLSQSLAELAAAPVSPPLPVLLSARAALRDTLQRHLKCEDWALYPRLKASDDAALAAMVRSFIEEMGGLAGAFAAYDTRWTAERVAADWPGFAAETRSILNALRERIASEERDLYPRAEALGTIGPQPVDRVLDRIRS